ncbi:HNH endonuclease [Oceanobacillus sp. J11TS1]|uniref:HNH endonuclease n=1 Tax=Oceanobacillus sp. J11TS1 TaxID=2807191 RepID=UPI001BB3B788|nr:HNH endonuclease signature motif containing protein [Oceanobacillus sp. J11TS1]
MMLKPLRPCREIGCNNLTRKTWCDSHANMAQESDRIYNQYKRNSKANAFYHSPEWRRVRELALIRDNHLCQRCLKEKKITKAQVVHHIVELLVDWSKRLDLDNLESLCHSCHNRIDHKTTNNKL